MFGDDILRPVTITNDPTYFDHEYRSPEYKKKVERCHEIALAGRKADKGKIQKAIEKYPESEALKNYLSIWYSKIGNIEKAWEVTQQIVDQHPDYLFGKLNLAAQYMKENKLDNVPEVLGQELSLTSLYPKRDVFHVSEVTSYERIIAEYLALSDRLEEAENRLELLQSSQIKPDDLQEIRLYLMQARFKIGIERLKEEQAQKIKVIVEADSSTAEDLSEKPPIFHHKEIEVLYEQGLQIDNELIQEILSLPKQTLVEDLHKVIQDSFDRHNYHFQKADESWDEKTNSFVIHSIFLLGEIGATESLPVVLELLKQDEEFIDLHMGDFITNYLWEPIYKISNEQLDVLFQFMLIPGVYTYSKSTISEVIEQIILNQPERRKEGLNWYRDVLNFFASCNYDDNIIDSDLLGLIVWAILNINGEELIPEIKKVYELGYVSLGICGDYESVKNKLSKPEKNDHRKNILSLSDRYEEVITTWHGYQNNEINDYDSSYSEEKYDPFSFIHQNNEPIRTEPKIGRNEPCRCGSGKKYKRCCGG